MRVMQGIAPIAYGGILVGSLALFGCGQAVRQRSLEPRFPGSNPGTRATIFDMSSAGSDLSAIYVSNSSRYRENKKGLYIQL